MNKVVKKPVIVEEKKAENNTDNNTNNSNNSNNTSDNNVSTTSNTATTTTTTTTTRCHEILEAEGNFKEEARVSTSNIIEEYNKQKVAILSLIDSKSNNVIVNLSDRDAENVNNNNLGSVQNVNNDLSPYEVPKLPTSNSQGKILFSFDKDSNKVSCSFKYLFLCFNHSDSHFLASKCKPRYRSTGF